MSQVVNETSVDVNYTYNNRGDISTITNSNVTYTYAYTSFGDLKSISVGDTALVTYTYISNKNRTVSKVTYANGQTVNYTYTDDVLTKIVSKDSNNTATNTITYDNDETGAVLKTKDAENGTVTKTVNDETQVWNTAETKLLYSYSSDENKLVETIDGTEYKTNYSETSDSTIEETNIYESVKTTSYGNTTVTVYSDLFGRTLKEETKSGNTIVLLKVYGYNSNGSYTTEQIKSVTTTVGSGTPETTRYTYDNNGNITGIYSKVGDGEEATVATYEYDELGQLIKENDKNYTYDDYGNILTAGRKTYSYGDSEWKDKLTSFNGETITYDESGNPTSYKDAQLTWQNGRELYLYDKGNIFNAFIYDESGLRTVKYSLIDEVETYYHYVWSEDKLTHQYWDEKYIHFYYDCNDEIIGFEYFDSEITSYYSYIKNIQGDVVGVIDVEGNIVATYTYDAWGNILTATGNLAEINPIRYRGYYYDVETGLYYLQSRYYDPCVGRFINADDTDYIGHTETMLSYNIFAYCENNGVNSIDSTGYWSKNVHEMWVEKYGKSLESINYKYVAKWNGYADKYFNNRYNGESVNVVFPFHSSPGESCLGVIKSLYNLSVWINAERKNPYQVLFSEKYSKIGKSTLKLSTKLKACVKYDYKGSNDYKILKNKRNNDLLKRLNNLKSAKNQSLALLGLALHTAQDYFAHSVPAKYTIDKNGKKWSKATRFLDATRKSDQGGLEDFVKYNNDSFKALFRFRVENAEEVTKTLLNNYVKKKEIKTIILKKGGKITAKNVKLIKKTTSTGSTYVSNYKMNQQINYPDYICYERKFKISFMTVR